MAKLKAYAIFDGKAEAYLRPFIMVNRGTAIRSFVDAVNDSTHEMCKHAEDYFLFELGEFDEESGVLSSNIVSLGNALSYKRGAE